ncbi:MAG: methyltransferase domain-containing protein [Pseudomonadota bacterium]
MSPHDQPMDGKPFNILFVQEFPCIRNYKMANALRSRGHGVTLGYTKARLSQVYKGMSDNVYTANIKLKDFKSLWEIAPRFDLVHCHNEPDILTVAALASGVPVIHDTHDLISLRAGGDPSLAFLEGVANRGAHGRIYTTPYQMEEAQTLYGIKGPSLVFFNYAAKSDLPRRKLPKLSSLDDRIHMVYEGGLGTQHRNFLDIFQGLSHQGVHVHIHPTRHDPELAAHLANFPLVHYNQPSSPREVIEIMTQYDIGLIPFNLEQGNKRFLDSTIANKLFEYLAAGLPVLASKLKSYLAYFEKNPVGMTFETVDDIVAALPHLKGLIDRVDFSKQIFTFEDEIQKIEDFYLEVLSAASRGLPCRPELLSRTPPPGQGAKDLKGNPALRQNTGDDFDFSRNFLKVEPKGGPAPPPRTGVAEKDATFYDQKYLSGGYDGIYHRHYSKTPYFPIWSKALELIKNINHPGIIEIGCGAGQFARLLFDHGLTDYRGVDLSPEGVALARAASPEQADLFSVDNAHSSDIYSREYQIAVLFEVLEHVEDDLAILEKIRPGSGVLFSVPNFDSEGHVRRFQHPSEIADRYKSTLNIHQAFGFKISEGGNAIFLVQATKK